MDETRWLDDREQTAWRGLQRMHAELTATLERELAADSGLSYQDYEVLVVLTGEPDGRLRAFQLARELAWEKSRLSHHVTRMVRRGLVTREKCPTDQRGAIIAVTDAGRTAIERAAPGHVAGVRRHFLDRLTPVQLDALAGITTAVLSGLDREPAPTG